jgi:group I intron endonuclease
MKSGIYILKFSNGDTYVGKSLDIHERWNQHYKNMVNGSAARAVQSAYIDYGVPTGEVLEYCHPDHIDILESYYVHKICPIRVLDKHRDKLKVSTANMIAELIEAESDIEDYDNKLADAWSEVERLRKQRSAEELKEDTENRIFEAEYENELLNTLVMKYYSYIKLPWWKKLFTKKPS